MSKGNSMGTRLVVDDKNIGSLTSINGVDITTDVIDLTCLDSADGFHEKDVDLSDVADITFSGFFDGANEGQQSLLTLLMSRAMKTIKIIFPAKIGYTWTCQGFVNHFATGAELSNGVSMEGSIAVSGKPTLAASTAEPAGNG